MTNISKNLPTGSLGLMISSLLMSNGRYKDSTNKKIYARLNEYNYVVDIEAADAEFVANSPFKEFYVIGEYPPETKKPTAKIGMLYNKNEDYFAFNKPYPSWILDENYEWTSPTAFPDAVGDYEWDETLLCWKPI
jgi:hypothetical protein